MNDKLHVDLTGAPQTMLATLYAKAVDADAVHPILGDTFAKDVVGRIDYDWSKTSINARTAPSVTMRTAQFDQWAREFLADHSQATCCTSAAGWTAGCFASTRDPVSSGTKSITPT